jgi:hypothetical protein
MQVSVAPPQPNAVFINPSTRVTPQPILADAKPQGNPVSMQNTLKDDLQQLEAQMTRLLSLISRDQPNGA